MDPTILDLVKVILASGGLATLGLTVRFYLRYRMKSRTLDAIKYLAKDAGSPKELQALKPVLDALVKNGSLPTIRGEEPPALLAGSKTEQP